MGLAVTNAGPEPAVIDEELCRRCISSLKPKTAAGEGAQEAKKDTIPFREARALLLSYQNILKIDNLVGFDKLIKLQLDNNIIEKIENLGHLTNLEARGRPMARSTAQLADGERSFSLRLRAAGSKRDRDAHTARRGGSARRALSRAPPCAPPLSAPA